MGPAPIRINWEEFDKLVSYQCTQIEIAHFFNCSVDTLERACIRDRGETLADIWLKKRSLGRVKLRKIQFDIAEGMGPGAAAMAIWLDKKIFPEENPDRIPIDVTPLSLSSRENKIIKTFPEFCETAGYFLPFQMQEEMRAFGFDITETRLLLGARGYGKTDFVTIMGTAYELYVAYMTGKDMSEFTNLIITKTKPRCGAIINEIADALEKNGVELEKRTESVIRVKGLIGQDHSVEAITIKTSMRGRHPKRIIMDDPVTDEDVSEAMRTIVKRRYDEAYKLCPNILIIGQPAHAHDLYAKLRGIIKTMEVPHGTIPELDADLEAMRIAGVDPNTIEMSYHLRIPVTGNTPFGNIKYIDQFPNGNTVAFIDPSDGGDYTAVTIGKMVMNGFIAQGRAWKLPWYHCLDEMIKEFKLRGVQRVCFETNHSGTQPLTQLRQALGPLGIGVVGVHSDTNKHATIMNAGSYAHLIHLSKESDKAYTDQVVEYEYGAKFDDSPDSLARCLVWIGLVKAKK